MIQHPEQTTTTCRSAPPDQAQFSDGDQSLLLIQAPATDGDHSLLFIQAPALDGGLVCGQSQINQGQFRHTGPNIETGTKEGHQALTVI